MFLMESQWCIMVQGKCIYKDYTMMLGEDISSAALAKRCASELTLQKSEETGSLFSTGIRAFQ